MQCKDSTERNSIIAWHFRFQYLGNKAILYCNPLEEIIREITQNYLRWLALGYQWRLSITKRTIHGLSKCRLLLALRESTLLYCFLHEPGWPFSRHSGHFLGRTIRKRLCRLPESYHPWLVHVRKPFTTIDNSRLWKNCL